MYRCNLVLPQLSHYDRNILQRIAATRLLQILIVRINVKKPLHLAIAKVVCIMHLEGQLFINLKLTYLVKRHKSNSGFTWLLKLSTLFKQQQEKTWIFQVCSHQCLNGVDSCNDHINLVLFSTVQIYCITLSCTSSKNDWKPAITQQFFFSIKLQLTLGTWTKNTYLH